MLFFQRCINCLLIHLKGLHIYMIGVGVQQTFVLLFLFFANNFHRTLLKEKLTNETSRALPMLYALYAVLTLITVSHFSFQHMFIRTACIS